MMYFLYEEVLHCGVAPPMLPAAWFCKYFPGVRNLPASDRIMSFTPN